MNLCIQKEIYLKFQLIIKVKKNNHDEYMLWLENFTLTHSCFSNSEWLYTQKNISLKDKVKVENLAILYHKIQKYAQKNFIYPKTQYRTEYYTIKYNEVGYKIGMIDEQSPTTYFCERIKTNPMLNLLMHNYKIYLNSFIKC